MNRSTRVAALPFGPAGRNVVVSDGWLVETAAFGPPSTFAAVDLRSMSLPADAVGLLEGLTTTRAIRRYRDEPVPDEVLQRCSSPRRELRAARTVSPSGSCFTDGPKATEVKALIGGAARRIWEAKEAVTVTAGGTGTDAASPKAWMARTMNRYVDEFERAPVLVLPCLVRYREPSETEGASIYPACQNLLLAARALGYGGVLTGFQALVAAESASCWGSPTGCCSRRRSPSGDPRQPRARRRRPLAELVYEETWEQPASFTIDPPGTRHMSAGPPPSLSARRRGARAQSGGALGACGR